MSAVAHRHDCRLGRADQFRDLRFAELRISLQEKSNRIGLVLALGDGGVARPLVAKQLRRQRLRREFEARLRIGLATRDLLGGGLAVCHRIETLHLVGHLAVGDGLDLERMQPAEIGDLLEGKRGVLDQPNSGRLGHQRSSHARILVAKLRQPSRRATPTRVNFI